MQLHHQQLLQQQHLQRMKPKPINGETRESSWSDQKLKHFILSACNQTDEEDIDIVGDDKERANTSLSSSSGGAANSSDAAVTASVIYGPPQFTEADVLACVASAAPEAERAGGGGTGSGGRSEEEAAAEAEDSEKENVVKKELVEEEVEVEKEDLEALKAKVRKLEENNKCSKCTVSCAPFL